MGANTSVEGCPQRVAQGRALLRVPLERRVIRQFNNGGNMKALLVSEYTTMQPLLIQEMPRPDVARDDVRFRVKATGIGFVEA